MPRRIPFSPLLLVPLLVAIALPAAAQERSRIRSFVETHCLDCHEGDTAKAGLDLAGLGFDLGDRKTFESWTRVYDRVKAGEMPPGKRDRPPRRETSAFLSALADPLVATHLARETAEGRATRRRLNRHEYENTIRDLFQAPWLQLKDLLPEDGEAHRFNKVGDALDVSHVQMARYLAAAEQAMREVLAAQTGPPPPARPPVTRFYARDMKSFVGPMKFGEFNRSPERATFPALGFAGQPKVRAFEAPLTVGEADPVTRDQEGIGVVASAYEPLEPKFDGFRAPRAGRYRVRLNAHAVWVGPGPAARWWVPNLDDLSRGRRPEPITVYAEQPSRLLRRLGAFDAQPDPTVGELEVFLLAGETIRPDPARLFRSRPPSFRNPLAEKDGQPGVVYRWLEVEGPLVDEWPPPGRVLLFGDLPIEPGAIPGTFTVTSRDPAGDARRLLGAFLTRALRRPYEDAALDRYTALVTNALAGGAPFAEAMLAGYTAVLCSPGFLYLDEAPGALDDFALASRLSYFLWNAPPDEALRAAAARGELRRPASLRAHAERLLDDPRARLFVDAFLDYWLDLRRMEATSPDAVLYPDYYLDDLLTESALEETRLFFLELLKRDLPARHLVDSDFVVVNERLAAHYGLPTAGLGVTPQPLKLPPRSPRGGLLTQASVLKVTANGTTTSPVLRGAWVAERLLGVVVPRRGARGRARHPRREDHPRAAREAPRGPGVRRLPREDRSRRVRARELRRARRVS
jgi:hypothetical protein